MKKQQQRGLTRIVGNVDIGSVEVQVAGVPLLFADTIDPTDAVTSLRESIIAANATCGSSCD